MASECAVIGVLLVLFLNYCTSASLVVDSNVENKCYVRLLIT
jgi:hypothetical protein